VEAPTDAAGNLVWPEPRPLGRGLLGWPAYVVPGLPDPATTGTNDASILFGNLRAAYRLMDRKLMTIRRPDERYATDGKVGLLVRHRVGGTWCAQPHRRLQTLRCPEVALTSRSLAESQPEALLNTQLEPDISGSG